MRFFSRKKERKHTSTNNFSAPTDTTGKSLQQPGLPPSNTTRLSKGTGNYTDEQMDELESPPTSSSPPPYPTETPSAQLARLRKELPMLRLERNEASLMWDEAGVENTECFQAYFDGTENPILQRRYIEAKKIYDAAFKDYQRRDHKLRRVELQIQRLELEGAKWNTAGVQLSLHRNQSWYSIESRSIFAYSAIVFPTLKNKMKKKKFI